MQIPVEYLPIQVRRWEWDSDEAISSLYPGEYANENTSANKFFCILTHIRGVSLYARPPGHRRE